MIQKCLCNSARNGKKNSVADGGFRRKRHPPPCLPPYTHFNRIVMQTAEHYEYAEGRAGACVVEVHNVEPQNLLAEVELLKTPNNINIEEKVIRYFLLVIHETNVFQYSKVSLQFWSFSRFVFHLTHHTQLSTDINMTITIDKRQKHTINKDSYA